MKTAILSSVEIDPQLRADAESVLKQDETLTVFLETTIRAQIDYRKSQKEFIDRGVASLAEAKRTGVYYSSEDVLSMLKAKLDAAKASKRS